MAFASAKFRVISVSDQNLGDFLSSSEDELWAQTQYISGLGPMGEKALFQLIATLRVDRQI